MRLFLAALLAALFAVPALAQNGTSVIPGQINGQGVITVNTTSVAVSASMSLTANSATFPAGVLPGAITLEPQGTAAQGIYVCWQGGTCTSSIGEYIAPGQSHTVYLGTQQNMTTQPPTVVSTAATAVVVEW